ncbi:MAG: sigma-70 family RNA polymerase sigma factor [Bacteroidetes bacterium]|nr:sigma-70 family RNA polymerase sigma factor [Bacteroidota bacterium]
MPEKSNDVTQLLLKWGDGDSDAMELLIPIVYDELHRLAHRHRRGERIGHTLNTTDIVHEAFMRLVRLDRIEWKNRNQFFALAAQAMRRLLINSAEKRRAQKRGGNVRHVPIDEEYMLTDSQSEELLALDEALAILRQQNERQHAVVECRFFGGLSVEETAATLGISPATVKRDWAFARAWLNDALASDYLAEPDK